MNTCRSGVVEAHRVRRPFAVLLAIAWSISIPSCTEVSGGAVELSWLLRPSNGDENACSDQSCCASAQVVDMRLMWEVDGVAGSDFWPCEDNRAVTGFEVPPGEATLWVVPECASGPAAENTYEAPARVVRTLVDGEVASLNAVVVAVQLADCESQACVCR